MKSSIYSYHHIQPELLPHFGFKIHISATIKNYKEISQIVTPFLEENHIAYKYIKKDADVYHSFSVNETMAESGKYFTIYPKNKENFLILLEKLYQLIPSYMEGIYIMSDRPYRDSKVIFYRFGTIKWDMVYVKGGHPTLIGPNQEEWQDYQKPYFDLPSWIEDIQEEDIIQKSYLSEHYSVSSILKADNGGNVYLGQSLSTGQNVIIKETRPHILYFDKIYKSDLRQMEFTNLQEQTPYTPQTIEHVKEWIHDYYPWC